MTFNLRYGTADDGENSWPFRREAVFEILRSADCHLVGVQEALTFQLTEIRQALPHYHWVGVGREDGISEGEHCAILYDTRSVELIGSNTFWFSDTPDVAGSSTWGNVNVRICTHGSFVAEGRRIDLYNLHIDHENSFSREASIDLLLKRLGRKADQTLSSSVPDRDLVETQQKIESRLAFLQSFLATAGRTPVVPKIVTGDFNCGESSPPVQEMLRAGLIDTYRAMNPDGPEQTSFHGWADVTEGEKIDYIFVDDRFTVVDAEIVRTKPFGKFASDHYPVRATLR